VVAHRPARTYNRRVRRRRQVARPACTYDNANRLTDITYPFTLRLGAAATLGLTYVSDNAGNRTQITDTQAGGTQITTFTYDALNRLTAATYPNGDMIALPPYRPDRSPAERVLAELRAAIERSVCASVDEKAAAVDAQWRHWDAQPVRVHPPTGWTWIHAARNSARNEQRAPRTAAGPPPPGSAAVSPAGAPCVVTIR
jgi:YD repeat-containing protein